MKTITYLHSVTYLPDFDENLQIRLRYQKLLQGQHLETLTSIIIDVDWQIISGSLFLENSEIDNIDLRFEYCGDLISFWLQFYL